MSVPPLVLPRKILVFSRKNSLVPEKWSTEESVFDVMLLYYAKYVEELDIDFVL